MSKQMEVRIPNPVRTLKQSEVEIRLPIVIEGIQVKELTMKKTIHLSELREMITEFFFKNAVWVPTLEVQGKASDIFEFFIDGNRVTNDEINSLEWSARIEELEEKIKFLESDSIRDVILKQLHEQSEEFIKSELKDLKDKLSGLMSSKPVESEVSIPNRETYPGPGHSEDL